MGGALSAQAACGALSGGQGTSPAMPVQTADPLAHVVGTWRVDLDPRGPRRHPDGTPFTARESDALDARRWVLQADGFVQLVDAELEGCRWWAVPEAWDPTLTVDCGTLHGGAPWVVVDDALVVRGWGAHVPPGFRLVRD